VLTFVLCKVIHSREDESSVIFQLPSLMERKCPSLYSQALPQGVTKNPHNNEKHIKILNIMLGNLSLVTHFCSYNIFTITINI